jgi:hypothetical protein
VVEDESGVTAGLVGRGWRGASSTMLDGGVGHRVGPGLVQGGGWKRAPLDFVERGAARAVGREGTGMGGDDAGWISPHLEERREDRASVRLRREGRGRLRKE